MTSTHAPQSEMPLDVLARQFVENIRHGATIGDMLDFTQHDYDVVYALGHTLYVQHRFEDAAKVFGYLVTHNHVDRRYMKAWAAALQMSGDYGNALRAYAMTSLMDLTHADPEPGLRSCECLLALGKREAAAQALVAVVDECEGEAHAGLRQRAQTMLHLITQPAASAASQETP